MSGRLRVLILIKGLDAGGAEMLIAELLDHRNADRDPDCDADQIGYEVAYVRADMAALVGRIAASVPVHCLGATSDTDVSWVPRLRTLLRRARPAYDVMHAHLASSASFGRLVARSLPARMRPKLVYTEHSSWTRLDVRTRALARASVRLDDASFAVSSANKALLPARLRSRYDVLHHGVDLTRFRGAGENASVRAELAIPSGNTLVVTAASLTAQKDYSTLLAATAQLADLPLTVVAAGTGPLAGPLAEEHRRLGLGDRFRFLGHRDDVPRLLLGADAFVLASAWESMPVAVMEALAAGLPIVATEVGELPQVLRDGRDALLVPAGSPPALAAAVRRLVSDSALQTRLARGAAQTAERFDIRRTVTTLEQTYARLAS